MRCLGNLGRFLQQKSSGQKTLILQVQCYRFGLFFFSEQVIIIFHVQGFHKHKLAGCYEVIEEVAGIESLWAPLVSCLLGLKEGWERKSGKGKAVKYAFSFFPSSLYLQGRSS